MKDERKAIERGERRGRRVREAVELLDAGVERILEGDEFKRYLAFAARFHRYSASNCLLILVQRPDATRVAGYRRWRELGRQVRRGEEGLKILAPVAASLPLDPRRWVREREKGVEVLCRDLLQKAREALPLGVRQQAYRHPRLLPARSYARYRNPSPRRPAEGSSRSAAVGLFSLDDLLLLLHLVHEPVLPVRGHARPH